MSVTEGRRRSREMSEAAREKAFKAQSRRWEITYQEPDTDEAWRAGWDAHAAQVVPQPNREQIARAIAEATIDWEDWGHEPGALAYKATDAVLALLSAQSDEIAESVASSDESYEMGRVAGYDEAMREVATNSPVIPDSSPIEGETSRDERDAKFFHDGWIAALGEIRLRGDRAVGEFLVEQLGEVQS